MVTDPGCMKTMDCVAICPDDALHFGFGKSAAATTKQAPRTTPVPTRWDLTWPEEWACAAICLLSFLAYRGLRFDSSVDGHGHGSDHHVPALEGLGAS